MQDPSDLEMSQLGFPWCMPQLCQGTVHHHPALEIIIYTTMSISSTLLEGSIVPATPKVEGCELILPTL